MVSVTNAKLPLVLALDDDLHQRTVLRAALYGFVEVDFHSTTESAMEAIKGNHFAAAIIDVHIKRTRDGGIGFIRDVKEFDPELAVILYTGDDSPAILEEALGVRALRRVLKSTGSATLRDALKEALDETTSRRAMAATVLDGKEAKAQLAEHVRTVELSRTLAGMYRGFFHALRNELSVLSLSAAVFDRLLVSLKDEGGNKEIRAKILEQLGTNNACNLKTVDKVVGLVLQAAEDRFGSSQLGDGAHADQTLDSLANMLASDPHLNGQGVTLGTVEQDIILNVGSVELLNVLYSVCSFLLGSSEGVVGLTVGCTIIDNAQATRAALSPAPIVLLNRQHLQSSGYVRFQLNCTGARLTQSDVVAALAEPPARGPLHNLAVLAAHLRCVVSFQSLQDGVNVEILVTR